MEEQLVTFETAKLAKEIGGKRLANKWKKSPPKIKKDGRYNSRVPGEGKTDI